MPFSVKPTNRRGFMKQMLALGTGLAGGGLLGTACSSPRKPNVILVICDALRGHSMSLNGGPAKTPKLLEMSKEMVNFTNAISQCGWTLPSFASIFTGEYPNVHGAYNRNRFMALDKELPRLQELFQKAGYYTLLLANKGTYANTKHSFDRGFDEGHIYPDDWGVQAIQRTMALQKMNKSYNVPLFIVIHILRPHSPYKFIGKVEYPQDIVDKLGDKLVYDVHHKSSDIESRAAYNSYLRCVENLDDLLSVFLTSLKSSPKNLFDWQNDVVIVTSDHGEEFPHENGFYHHGRSPSIETLSVPLLAKLPGIAPRQLDGYYENASIFPTLLDIAGIPRPPRTAKKEAPVSLLPVLKGDSGQKPKYAFSEALFKDSRYPGMPEQKVIISADGLKLNYNTKTKKAALYNLPKDPTEINDLSGNAEYDKIREDLMAELTRRTALRKRYL